VEPGEGTFDDPAVATEAGAVLGHASRDDRLDAALPDQPTVFVVVVAAVGEQHLGAATRPPDPAAYRRDEVEQADQLGDVVAVAARERPGERQPAAVYEEMLLAAQAAPVDRARPCLGAPFFACT
jgi:hypothetical protein